MNYYEVLGVSKTATNKEIKKAYKQLVKKYHPDIFDGEKSIAEAKIKEINSAYAILSNEKLRQEYDESLVHPEFDFKSSDTNSDKYESDIFNKYSDLYKYDYYQRYTTNYYGVSREDLKTNKNMNQENSNSLNKSKARFILILGLTIIFLLIIVQFLLSYLKTLLSEKTEHEITNETLERTYFIEQYENTYDFLIKMN